MICVVKDTPNEEPKFQPEVIGLGVGSATKEFQITFITRFVLCMGIDRSYHQLTLTQSCNVQKL
jgi:hypothetical protein